MRTTVPERIVMTCDACGKSGPPGKTPFRVNAWIRFEFDALDYLGEPAARSSQHKDLCDLCGQRIGAILQRELSREEAQDAEKAEG